MVKVLHKALHIIEHIALDPETPHTLGSITDQLGLNQPTCARILKTLVNAGYIEQVAPKKGYVLGPMAYMLPSRGQYRRDIVAVAAPLVAQCAKHTREMVLVATFRRGRRYIICHVNGNPELRVQADLPFYEDIYTTATGRLLLAFAEQHEIEYFLHTRGLPKGAWPGVRTRSDVFEALDAIRRQGMFIDAGRDQTIAFALPIKEGTRVVAALGIGVLKSAFTGSHEQKLLKQSRHTAEQISRRLSERANRKEKQ